MKAPQIAILFICQADLRFEPTGVRLSPSLIQALFLMKQVAAEDASSSGRLTVARVPSFPGLDRGDIKTIE
jgi:hypothetical protein